MRHTYKMTPVQILLKLLSWLFLLFMAMLIVLPILWTCLSAFRPPKMIIQFPPTYFPRAWVMDNFIDVFKRIPILLYVKNTFLFAIVTTVVSLLFNAMAGYAFARVQFKGKNVIFTILMASMMIPFQVIMLPLFMELHFLGLVDTFAGLVVPRFAGVVGIFFMRSFYTTLPKQLEEAGRLDGLTEFGIFFRIMMPLCKYALVTQAVLSFTGAWNDLLWPLLMTNSPDKRMLSNGIVYFVGQSTTNYGPAFAAGLISIVPLLLIFIFGQKYFVNSIVSSGMKE